jgi:peptidyl-prolyl cis-trans isomerase SurA
MLAASLVIAVAPAVAQNPKSDFETQSSPYTGKVVEEIVARVNDQVISLTDYKRAEQQLEQEAQQAGWSEQELYQQRRNLLRGLIDKQLLLSKGKQLGITGGNRLINRLDQLRKQNHLPTMQALQKAVEAQGIAWEDFKQQIRDNIVTQSVIGQEVGSHIDVAPSEIKDYYDSHKQEFERPEEVSLNEILIATPDPDSAEQVDAAKKKAEAIEEQLKGGANFEDLAKKDSGGPTAAEGGVLGVYKAGQLPKVMEDATFGLKPGGVTEPIRTKQGWLILEVTKHIAAGLAPMDEVQNQIQEELGMQKMEPAVRKYLTKLRTQAYIDIRPGYVDSGATPNEMKFVQSAYVTPVKKKKKYHARERFQGRTRHRHASKKESRKEEIAQERRSQRPGKKEKIRYGQAPRETLPSGPTKTVNAGAEPNQGSQVSENYAGLAAGESSGQMGEAPEAKPRKWRLTDELKLEKKKRKEEEEAKKHHDFVPPTLTKQEQSTAKRQDAALGLRGDTSHLKKVNPAKEGPKRRFSDEGKKKKEKKESESTPETGTTPQS